MCLFFCFRKAVIMAYVAVMVNAGVHTEAFTLLTEEFTVMYWCVGLIEKVISVCYQGGLTLPVTKHAKVIQTKNF